MSIQDFVDAKLLQKEKTGAQAEPMTYDQIRDELKDCIFFDRFQKGRCLSLYEVLPSMVDVDNRGADEAANLEMYRQT